MQSSGEGGQWRANGPLNSVANRNGYQIETNAEFGRQHATLDQADGQTSQRASKKNLGGKRPTLAKQFKEPGDDQGLEKLKKNNYL